MSELAGYGDEGSIVGTSTGGTSLDEVVCGGLWVSDDVEGMCTSVSASSKALISSTSCFR